MVGLKKQNKMISKWSHIFNKIHKNKINFHAQEHWNILLNKNDIDLKKEHDFIHDIKKIKFISKREKLDNNFKEIFNKNILDIKSLRLVFINGFFNEELSSQNFDPLKIKIYDSNNIEEKFHSFSKTNFFYHLIESLSKILIKIEILSNQKILIPLYLIYISYFKNTLEINNIFYRTNLNISKNSSVSVIEHYIDINDVISFTGSNLITNLQDNTKLLHTKIFKKNIKSYHIYYDNAILTNNSELKKINLFLGNKKILYNSYIKLNGCNSNIIEHSLSLPQKNKKFEINNYLEHNKNNCNSIQIHKTIIMKKASLIFNGIIKVAKNTFLNDGKLTNNNLILSKNARIYTQPQLEIYSSDVKCSHGATIGYIDKNQIFYLQSRGIKKKLAKNMIIFAFAYSVASNIKNIIIKKFVVNAINLYLKQEINNAV